MKKFFSFLGIIVLSAQLMNGDPVSQMYKDNPWDYMEYAFITKPENKFKQLNLRLLKWTLTGAGAATGYLISSRARDRIYDSYHIRLDKLENCEDVMDLLIFLSNKLFIPVGSVTSGIVTYFLAASVIRSRIEYLNLKQFVTEWQSNKESTPKELHMSFDALEKSLKSDVNLFDNQSMEFVFNIKNRVHQKFPEKYPDSKIKKDFFTLKFFNLDVGSTLSGCGRLISGIADLIKVIFREDK